MRACRSFRRLVDALRALRVEDLAQLRLELLDPLVQPRRLIDLGVEQALERVALPDNRLGGVRLDRFDVELDARSDEVGGRVRAAAWAAFASTASTSSSTPVATKWAVA
jgi:hypothetical protein